MNKIQFRGITMVDSPKNRETMERIVFANKKIASSILGSDALLQLKEDTLAKLRTNVTDDAAVRAQHHCIELHYSSPKTHMGFCTVINWAASAEETDDDGAAWVRFTPSVNHRHDSSYRLAHADLGEHMTIWQTARQVGDMVLAIGEEEEFWVYTLEPDEKNDRDKKNKHTQDVYSLQTLLNKNKAAIRKKLRTGGACRYIPPHFLAGIKAGVYDILIDDGSRHRADLKMFRVTVGELGMNSSVRRIERTAQ